MTFAFGYFIIFDNMLIRLFTSGYSLPIILILGVALISAVILSMVIHENAHGFVALKCGDDTAKKRGRLTLNPLAHFDYAGLILMLLVGFGWAKPVPINPYNFKNRKVGVILVSLAGITSNLILAGICLLLLYFLTPYLVGLCQLSSAVRLLGYLILYFLQYMVALNIMLAFFNLLPICPLDGFRFADSLLPPGNGYSTFMYKYGNICLIAFVGVCFLLERVGLEKYSVFYQVQSLAYRLIAIAMGG